MKAKPVRSRIDEKQLIKEYLEAKTSIKDLLEKYNISDGTLRNCLRDNSVDRNRQYGLTDANRELQNLQFSDLEYNQQQILLGSLLGDGFLCKKENSICFAESHCLRHKAYLDWKYEILQNLCLHPPVINYGNKSKRTWDEARLTTISLPLFKTLESKWYYQTKDGRIKCIPKDYLDQIEPLGLAVWYMDDGNANQEGDSIRLCTHGFSNEEQIILQQFLNNKFDLDVRIGNHHTKDADYQYLIMYSDSMRKFVEIIKPNILPIFEYKLKVSPGRKRKLVKEQVLEIKKHLKEEILTIQEIANIYNVTHNVIRSIMNNETYKEVTV